MNVPLKARRKPVQSRSKVTQNAILEAFVRLLLEKGYARLTIRDIAAVAGVGLGTVYEYFPSKKSIAANCIHKRFKRVGKHMSACTEQHRGEPLAEIVDAVLDLWVALHVDHPQQWSALIFLERQISDLDAYQNLYDHFVNLWRQVIDASQEHFPESSIGETAYVLHATVYGLVYQTLIRQPLMPGEPSFRIQLGALVHGYLNTLGVR